MNTKKTVVEVMKLIIKKVRKGKGEPCNETISIAAKVSAICLASAIKHYRIDKAEQTEILNRFMAVISEEIETANNSCRLTA